MTPTRASRRCARRSNGPTTCSRRTEQRLFARLSVFAGGCTLEAAEEVSDADLDTLQSLVEKSLVRHTDGRFWMLETIREYAVEQLGHTGEGDAYRRRHLEWFLTLAEENEFESRGGDRQAASSVWRPITTTSVRRSTGHARSETRSWSAAGDRPLALLGRPGSCEGGQHQAGRSAAVRGGPAARSGNRPLLHGHDDRRCLRGPHARGRRGRCRSRCRGRPVHTCRGADHDRHVADPGHRCRGPTRGGDRAFGGRRPSRGGRGNRLAPGPGPVRTLPCEQATARCRAFEGAENRKVQALRWPSERRSRQCAASSRSRGGYSARAGRSCGS